MVAIGKKFGQFKQWTGEKLGNTEKSEFSEPFRRQIELTEARIAAFEKLTLYATEYLKSMDRHKLSAIDIGKCFPIESLSAALLQQGAILGAKNDIGKSYLQLGEMQQRLASVQATFAESAKRTLITPLTDIAAQCKEYERIKKKLANRRLDYDAKMNTLRKSSSRKPEAEEELRVAQEKYETSTNDLGEIMNALETAEQTLLPCLKEFNALQKRYFEASLECFEKEGNIAAITASPHKKPLSVLPKSTEPARRNSVSSIPSMTSHSDITRKSSLSSISKPQEKLRETPDSERESITSTASSLDKYKHAKTIKKVKVLYFFAKDKGNPDEMSIEKDQILDVLYIEEGGWWIGRNTSGEIGMFPSNYVEDYKEREEIKHEVPKTGSSLTETLSLPKIEKAGIDFTPFIKTAATTVASTCKECSCTDFSANVFKKGQCNNCFHSH